MRMMLIANPAARLVDNGQALVQVTRELQSHGAQVEIHLTAMAGDATELAREAVERGIKRVVVAGGDGTINEAVQGLARTETELAILPLGTGNVIARYAGLDEWHIADACRIAATGPVRVLDLGVMGGRYFVTTAGAGLDAQIVSNLDPWWKQQVGKLAFLGEFFKTVLLEEQHVFRVRVGEEVIRGPMWGVLICNTNEYSWRLRPAADVREDDGLLDAVFIHRQGFLGLMDLAARMFISGENADDHPTATVLRVSHMRLSARPAVPYQVEGEVIGTTPVEVAVAPKALRMVVAPHDPEEVAAAAVSTL